MIFYFKMNRFINAGIYFFILYLIYRELHFHQSSADIKISSDFADIISGDKGDFQRLGRIPESPVRLTLDFILSTRMSLQDRHLVQEENHKAMILIG